MQGGSVIFIADDEQFAGDTIVMMLTALKQSTQLFTDGLSLVNEYKAKNGSGISLILMDIAMPGMDGFAAATEIRNFEKSKGLPAIKIFGVSGDNDAKTREASQKVGMNDLIVKPVTKAKLSAVL